MSEARFPQIVRDAMPQAAAEQDAKAQRAAATLDALCTNQQPQGGIPMSATIDADGNVRMEATLTPADRQVLRETARDMAVTHAERIGNPGGLRGLFPSNLVRFVPKKRPQPKE